MTLTNTNPPATGDLVGEVDTVEDAWSPPFAAWSSVADGSPPDPSSGRGGRLTPALVAILVTLVVAAAVAGAFFLFVAPAGAASGGCGGA